MYDVIISGGTVIDGTRAPGRRTDVGIRDGRVVHVGTIDDDAVQVIDAAFTANRPGTLLRSGRDTAGTALA